MIVYMHAPSYYTCTFVPQWVCTCACVHVLLVLIATMYVAARYIHNLHMFCRLPTNLETCESFITWTNHVKNCVPQNLALHTVF